MTTHQSLNEFTNLRFKGSSKVDEQADDPGEKVERYVISWMPGFMWAKRSKDLRVGMWGISFCWEVGITLARKIRDVRGAKLDRLGPTYLILVKRCNRTLVVWINIWVWVVMRYHSSLIRKMQERHEREWICIDQGPDKAHTTSMLGHCTTRNIVQNSHNWAVHTR